MGIRHLQSSSLGSAVADLGNIFTSLLPYPKEDDFTAALAFVIGSGRQHGPDVLRQVLSLLPNAFERFDFDSYVVKTQRPIRAGRFDILISSPAVFPRSQIVLENKVELSLDERSRESIQKYVRWLGAYRGTANLLILNTKYSIPENVDLPKDVVVIHWHMIAKAIRDYLRAPIAKEDNLSKDFLEFLEANDMGPLDELNPEDGAAFWNFRKTNMKFDYVLDGVKSHFKQLGYKVTRDVDLTFDEPYYGIKLMKGEWTDLFNYYVNFRYRAAGENNQKSLYFVSQLYIENRNFYDFLEGKYSDEIADATRKSGATLDTSYYWTIAKNLETIENSDLEAEKQSLLGFSIEGLRLYQSYLIPILEKAAKWFAP